MAKISFKEPPLDKIESDGGSNCGYYGITLPKEVITINKDGSVSFQVKDIIQYSLGNDFDKGNIYKALHRLGNKEGIDEKYDLKKIEHTVKEMLIKNSIDEQQKAVK